MKRLTDNITDHHYNHPLHNIISNEFIDYENFKVQSR